MQMSKYSMKYLPVINDYPLSELNTEASYYSMKLLENKRNFISINNFIEEFSALIEKDMNETSEFLDDLKNFIIKFSEESHGIAKELLDELYKKDKKLNEYSDNISELKTSLSHITEEKKFLTEEYEKLKIAYDSLNSEILEKQAEDEIYERNLTDLKLYIQNLEKENKLLKKEILENNKSYKETITNKSEEIKYLKQLNNQLTNENSKLLNEKALLNESLSILNKRNKKKSELLEMTNLTADKNKKFYPKHHGTANSNKRISKSLINPHLSSPLISRKVSEMSLIINTEETTYNNPSLVNNNKEVNISLNDLYFDDNENDYKHFNHKLIKSQNDFLVSTNDNNEPINFSSAFNKRDEKDNCKLYNIITNATLPSDEKYFLIIHIEGFTISSSFPDQSFFYKLFDACKVNSNKPDYFILLNKSRIYSKCKEMRVPFNKYYDFINSELKVHLVNLQIKKENKEFMKLKTKD